MVSGLERMTFEVLRVFRRHARRVHCIVNDWENHRIVPLAERSAQAGRAATTDSRSAGRRTRSGICGRSGTSCAPAAGYSEPLDIRSHARARAGYLAVLQNAPALALLRLLGVRIVFRIGNAPERGQSTKCSGGRVLPPFVSEFVPNRVRLRAAAGDRRAGAEDHTDQERAQPACGLRPHGRRHGADVAVEAHAAHGRPDCAVQGDASRCRRRAAIALPKARTCRR